MSSFIEDWEIEIDSLRNYDGREYGHGLHEEVKAVVEVILTEYKAKVARMIKEYINEADDSGWMSREEEDENNTLEVILSKLESL